jgi:hypothetical protein
MAGDDLPDSVAAFLKGACAPITYAALAAALNLTEQGRIATLTAALEQLMERDAAAGRPLLAVWVVSRATGLPARGFFQKAAALGRYSGPEEGDANWVAAERARLSS